MLSWDQSHERTLKTGQNRSVKYSYSLKYSDKLARATSVDPN